jgi:MFS family permease
MPRAQARLVASSLIDWTGTGFYLAISAIFLTRSVGLSAAQVGLALAAAGLVAFAGSVPAGRLADRFGHREALIALHVVRAAAFAALTAVHGALGAVAVLSAIGLADAAAASVTQALASDLAGPARRVALMARLRVVTNIGITLGTIPAGLVLTGHAEGFGALLLANAVSYLIAAALVATLPRPERAARARRPRLLVPSRPTLALMIVDGLMSMWQVMLNVGLPLWLLQATAAPRALVAVLYATNTVIAVALQARASRSVRGYAGAARAQQAAGYLLAASCAGLAAAVLGGPGVATAALCAAVACLSFGELLKISAAWEITFTLAPARRQAEFFATYGLGRVAFQVCGPVLITGVVLAVGSAGWLLLACAFVLASAVTPLAARRALARPVRGPRNHPPAIAPLAAPA